MSKRSTPSHGKFAFTIVQKPNMMYTIYTPKRIPLQRVQTHTMNFQQHVEERLNNATQRLGLSPLAKEILKILAMVDCKDDLTEDLRQADVYDRPEYCHGKRLLNKSQQPNPRYSHWKSRAAIGRLGLGSNCWAWYSRSCDTWTICIETDILWTCLHWTFTCFWFAITTNRHQPIPHVECVTLRVKRTLTAPLWTTESCCVYPNYR